MNKIIKGEPWVVNLREKYTPEQLEQFRKHQEATCGEPHDVEKCESEYMAWLAKEDPENYGYYLEDDE